MSRSRRKTPIIGNTTCESEKKDKKIWHRRWRTKEKIKLLWSIRADIENHISTDLKEVSDPWIFGKDGKHRLSPSNRIYKYIRK